MKGKIANKSFINLSFKANVFGVFDNNHKFTYLFDYINKKRWISGPVPPTNVAFLHSSAIAINKTAAIFLRASPTAPFTNGAFIANYHEDMHKLNYIYNFESKSWQRIIDMPLQMQFSTFNLPLTITFNKDGTKLLHVFGFHNHFDTLTVYDLNRATLWTLNLNMMNWSNQELFSRRFIGYGKNNNNF